MWFNSVEYFIFFLLTYFIYWYSPFRYRKYILLLSSFVFYAYWSLGFFLHFLFVLLISFFLIKKLHKNQNKLIFILAIGFNLTNLIFFKYTQTILKYLIEYSPETNYFQSIPTIILPLAISFYTFQIIAYIVDVWRQEIQESNLIDFSIFIFFFPQLIAGPIMRHKDFFFQLKDRMLIKEDVYSGIFLILLGLVKKVIIADQIARIINPVWDNPSQYTSLAVSLSAVSFLFQIYGDFSGYTDIARGSARLLGFHIPENFFSPFLSVSFAESWKRWHVTLSTWIRDYMYIPLGGNRVSSSRFALNTIIVMSLGGLWHGNTYTFFFWGLLHGLFLIVEKHTLKVDRNDPRIHYLIIGWIITTLGWMLGAIIFRSEDLTKFISIFHNIFYEQGFKTISFSNLIGLILFSYLLQFLHLKNYFQSKWEDKTMLVLLILSIIIFYKIARIPNTYEQFIYFQF